MTLKYDLVNYTVLLSLRAPVSAAEVMRTEGGNFTTQPHSKTKNTSTNRHRSSTRKRTTRRQRELERQREKERRSTRNHLLKMETSLKIDSKTRRSCIFVKQRFTNSENYCLTLSGTVDLQNAKCKGNAYVRKKFFPSDLNPIVSRIDCGVNYDTETDDVVYKLRGKKSFDITQDGLTTLDVKGGVDFGLTSSTPKMDGKIELSKTLFNFQPDQDLRMKIGFDAQTKRFYGQIRENNWSINADFSKNKSWNFQYDL